MSGTTFTVAGGDGLTQQSSGLAVDSTVARTTGDTFTGSVTIDDNTSGYLLRLIKNYDVADSTATLLIANDADGTDDPAFEVRGNTTGTAVDTSNTNSSADTTFMLFADGTTAIGYSALGNSYAPPNSALLAVNGVIDANGIIYATGGNSGEWNTAYDDSVSGISISNTGPAALSVTLTQPGTNASSSVTSIQMNTLTAGSGLSGTGYNGATARTWTVDSTVLRTTTSFGGDVSGTYDAIVVANDSHTHSFDNLTGKQSGTGDYSTNGNLTSGRGSGGAALTINDGQGNANVTFNHEDGSAEQAGNSARIVVNTDSTSGAQFSWELKSNVTAGAVTTVEQMKLTESELDLSNNNIITNNTVQAGSFLISEEDIASGLTMNDSNVLGSNSGGYVRWQLESVDQIRLEAQSISGTESDFYLRQYTNDLVFIDGDQSGNLGFIGINTTSPSTRLDVNGTISSTGGNSNQWNSGYDNSVTGFVRSATADGGYLQINRQISSNLGIRLKSLGIGDCRVTGDFAGSTGSSSYMPDSDDFSGAGLTPIFSFDWAGPDWGGILNVRG